MSSAYFAYRAGLERSEDERDAEIERRVRELELGMVEIQVLIRERKAARERAEDRHRFSQKGHES